MKIRTTIDNALYNELIKIKDSDKFASFIFNYCESQEDRQKLLAYILDGNNDRKEVLLMASQIGIESGTVDGELEEL